MSAKSPIIVNTGTNVRTPHLVLPLGDYCKFQGGSGSHRRRSKKHRHRNCYRHGDRIDRVRDNGRNQDPRHQSCVQKTKDFLDDLNHDIAQYLNDSGLELQLRSDSNEQTLKQSRPGTAQASCQTALTSENLSSFHGWEMGHLIDDDDNINVSPERMEAALHYRLRRFFHAWKNVSIANRVNMKFEPKRQSIYLALSAISLGVDGYKGRILQHRRKDGLARARENLSKKLRRRSECQHEIITTEMLKCELRKMFYDELYAWNRKRDLSLAFTAMKQHTLEAKERNIRMRHKWLRGSMDAWMEFTLQRRQMYEGIRTVPRYDQNQLDIFAYLHPIKIPFMRWVSWSRRYTEVKRRRRVIFTRIARQCFQVWRTDAKVRRKLRLRVVDNWVDYRKRILQPSFHGWKTWVITVQNERRDRERFLYSHKIMKQRRMKRLLFGFWKNWIIYGRMVLPDSRSNLLKQLADQQNEINDLKRRLEGQENIDTEDENALTSTTSMYSSSIKHEEESTVMDDVKSIDTTMRDVKRLSASLEQSRMEIKDLRQCLDTVKEWKEQSLSLREYITSRQVFTE